MFKLFEKRIQKLKDRNKIIENENELTEIDNNFDITIEPIVTNYMGFKTKVNNKELVFEVNKHFNYCDVFIINLDKKDFRVFIKVPFGLTLEDTLKEAIIRFAKQSSDFVNQLYKCNI